MLEQPPADKARAAVTTAEATRGAAYIFRGITAFYQRDYNSARTNFETVVRLDEADSILKGRAENGIGYLALLRGDLRDDIQQRLQRRHSDWGADASSCCRDAPSLLCSINSPPGCQLIFLELVVQGFFGNSEALGSKRDIAVAGRQCVCDQDALVGIDLLRQWR